MGSLSVYGIGNPLIDVLADVTDAELDELALHRGTMHLVDDAAADHILERISEREKTYASGGACPNTMNTLAALGATVTLSGCIGTDELGALYARGLAGDGVQSDLHIEDGPTGSSIVLVSPDGERTMCTRLGVCRSYSPEAVNHEMVRAASVLYFTGYMWDTEAQKAAVTAAIETAHRSETAVVFDVADPMAVERSRDAFLQLIETEVTVVLANRAEARMLLDDQRLSAADAAGQLSRRTRVAVVKDGARGSSVAVDGNAVSVSAQRVTAVDTTGAGDSYAAGFIFGLLSESSPVDAARLASDVAARIVRQRGAQFGGEARRELSSTASRHLPHAVTP